MADLGTLMKEAMAKGEDISAIYNQRLGKTSLPEYSKFANDSLMQDAQKYMADYQKAQQAKAAQPIAQPVVQPVAQQTIPVSNTSVADDYIKQLAAAQQATSQAGLDKAYQSNLSSINAEKASINPAYNNQRNTVATASQIAAKNLAEYMAQRGQTNSGANIQAEISRQGALQGNIGALNAQEQKAYDDIAKRTTDLTNAYNSDIASNASGTQATMMQNLINQYNQNRNYSLAEQNQLFNQNMANNEYNLANQNQTFNQNMATNQYNMANQNQAFNQGLATNQYNLDAQNQAFNQYIADKKLNETISQNKIAQDNWQKQFTYAQMQDAIQNQINKGQLSISAGNLALQQAKFTADQDPTSLDNQYKQAQINGVNLGNQNQVLQNQALQSQINNPTISPEQMISDTMYSFQRDGLSKPQILENLSKYAPAYIADMGKTSYDWLVNYYSK